MNNVPKIQSAEDEEDLEALRLAALQSLKKKDGSTEIVGQQFGQHLIFDSPPNFRPMKGMRNKKGRFFGLHTGRGGKNSHFNNRSRNTNLISIPTVPSQADVEENQTVKVATCYHTLDKEISKEDGTSKFSRYNNSDKSESESELEEEATSDDDNPGKLERSNSLEALMEELDNEIQGKIKEGKEKLKVKKTKRKKQKTSESDGAIKSDVDDKVKESEGEPKNIVSPSEIATDKAESVQLPGEVQENLPKPAIASESKPQYKEFTRMPNRKRHRSRSPPNRRFYNRHRQRMNNFNDIPNNPPPHMLFGPPVPFPPQILPFPNQQFIPFGPPMINIPNRIPPPFYERPLSPLAINTESLTTATMAPLSPRSAAFVLENKAIIERRKRSPRRSYSRSVSRSPPPRRSPRRSISPRRLSRSPRRLSPRRRSLSPRRKSLSPRRRSISPKRRKIAKPPENNQKSKASVRERLGAKSAKTDENVDKPVEKPKEKETSPKKDEKSLDPVLEARRKKFESNEIKKKEGIIRLKPKDDAVPITSTEIVSSNKENQTPTPTTSTTSVTSSAAVTSSTTVTSSAAVTSSSSSKDVAVQAKESERPVVAEPDQSRVPDEFEELEKLLNENPFEDVLSAKVDGIFSDEDSDSDNEGRFKVKRKASEKLPVIPFTKLASDARRDIKAEPLLGPNRRTPRRRSRHEMVREARHERDRRRLRGRTPPDIPKKEPAKKVDTKKTESQEKPTLKHRITLRSERYTPPIDKRFERKIEIKIKNPSKYERIGKPKVVDAAKAADPSDRKIKVEDKDVEAIEDDVEPEIIIENDSGDEENSNTDEGDLRAQLSKKRAEKLHKIPVEEVSSRLLQYALQGAVFKKSKKRSKEKKVTSNNDGKLPIHLRLGIANQADIFPETKVKRKSRKRKNREVPEQV